MSFPRHLQLELDGAPVEFCLDSGETIQASVSKVVLWVMAILFQVHSFSPPSAQADIGIDMQQNYVTGAHIGFVHRLPRFANRTSAQIRNPGNNRTCFEAFAVGITSAQPVPGGCAQDMNLPMVPAIKHIRSSHFPGVSVRWEPADRPISSRSAQPSSAQSCEDLPSQDKAIYHLYATFLDHSTISQNQSQQREILIQEVESSKNKTNLQAYSTFLSYVAHRLSAGFDNYRGKLYHSCYGGLCTHSCLQLF